MKKIWKLLLGSILLLLPLSACSSNSTPQESADKKLSIITTFYPMYDFTKNITGNSAHISMLIDGTVEPHDYEPSAKDIAKIEDADVFVYNSKEMETWVPKVLDNIDTDKVTVIDASKGIELMEGNDDYHDGVDDHDHDKENNEHSHVYDPHVWLDPVLAIKEVENIRNGLIKADEKNKAIFEKNASQFITQLNELNQEYEQAFQNAKNRVFVTQHAAFSYLARQYHLTQEPISGISPDVEPSAAQLAQIEEFVKTHDVKVIYTEELSSSKIAETIAKATGAKLETLSTLEGLTEQEQKDGKNYISVMKENLNALKQSIN